MRSGLSYCKDVKWMVLQTQNFTYTDPFLLDMLLEIEGKCYLIHN